jgi:hypothetical protein
VFISAWDSILGLVFRALLRILRVQG